VKNGAPPFNVEVADHAAIARAAQLLRDGALVAFPTETVYGLGGDAGNAAAVRAIFAAKGRPADHPVIVHLHDAAQMRDWAREIPADAQRLADAFWPGPLTLILPRAAGVGDSVTGGQDSVGLRVPSHPVARALLRVFVDAGGSGIAAPSANRFGRISPTTAAHVAADLGEDVALILDGGACAVGIESTIVAFGDGEPLLLRPGGIALDAVTRVLGRAPRTTADDAPRASGTLASHYAPRAPARLIDGKGLHGALPANGREVAVLARTVHAPASFDGLWIGAPRDVDAYAQTLYANLRALDSGAATLILIEAPPDDAAWLAVRDRLTRATHGEEDDRS
jgi:L-threonylcarbamoyladenylate synthase